MTEDWTKGFVHVYTGDGKGKTTAALGLALRAAGAGLSSYIGQFMKGRRYSELDSALMLAPLVKIEQFGQPDFCIAGKVQPVEFELARAGLEKIKAALDSGLYKVVVMDEICTALHFGLVPLESVLDAVANKPVAVELVLTGRRAPQELIEAADLVTEMKEIKHYYRSGVEARRGIES